MKEHTDTESGDTMVSSPVGRDAEWLGRTPPFAARLLDRLPDPILVCNAEGAVCYANRQAARTLGHTAESLLTLGAPGIDTRWSKDEWTALWSRADLQGSARFETVYRCACGGIMPVEAEAFRLEHEGEQYLCVVARDKSNSPGREGVSSGIEERFRQLVEGSLQGICVDAYDNRPLFVNQAYAELYGYDSPAEIMQLDSLLELVAPDDRERLAEYTRQREQGGDAPSLYEFTGVRRDGSRITVLCSASAVVWDGTPAVQAAVMDITDRRRVEHVEKEQEATRARLMGAMEASSEAFALFDADDRLYYTNQRYREMMSAIRDLLVPGTTFRQVLEQSVRRGALPEARGREEQWIETRLAQHRSPAGPIEHYRADSGIWVRIREQRLDDGSTFVVVSDISRIKQSEREIADKTEQLEAAYENMDQGIVMLDDRQRVVAFNQRLLKTLDLPSLDLKPGMSIQEVVSSFARQGGYGPGEAEELVGLRMEQILSGQPYRFVIKSPYGRYLEVRGRPTSSGGHVITHTDITETHQLSRQLSYQASHDSLTGLTNRTRFETALEQAIRTARDDATHALCYLDLDQFKVINDTCGHLAGDELLRQLGGLLPERVREGDILARLGGDEFGLLLENCSVENAARLADQVRDTIESYRFLWEGKLFRVGTSIGVVPITRYTTSVSDILSYADTACYAAKDEGGNRVHIYHANDTELARRRGDMQWVSDLNRSLEHDDFVLYRQPILNLRDDGGQSLHYEILLRLKDANGRLFQPTSFLRSAERFGLMVKLDRWVISSMLTWMEAMETQGTQPVMYFINISGMSLRDEAFRRFVIQRLEQRGASRFRICFEVTETAAVTSLASTADFIERIQELGHCCALDDFGSGLSSFAYLRNLPVDYLKIDGQFVRDIATDPIDLAMVKSITEIAKVMGKQTIAEYAECQAVVEHLRELGVDFAQGYSIGYPVPLTDPA